MSFLRMLDEISTCINNSSAVKNVNLHCTGDFLLKMPRFAVLSEEDCDKLEENKDAELKFWRLVKDATMMADRPGLNTG